MSKFKIEKDVPLESWNKNRKASIESCPFPFEEMEISDSFEVKLGKQSAPRVRAKLQTWVNRFKGQRNEDFKVKTRVTETGVRVWRVS